MRLFGAVAKRQRIIMEEPIILFEDNHILVAVKPQNVPVQADSSGDDDMLSMLKKYLQENF